MAGLLFGMACIAAGVPAVAASADDDATVVDARQALQKKDRVRLAEAQATAAAQHNPLAMWVDYWELTNRIGDVQQSEVDAFTSRWQGTYVEDRLRNDWLLELGKRQDWTNFAIEQPRFRMNDDREVNCYALLVEHLQGKDVKAAALAAWLAQRDADDGCALMASTLREAKVFSAADIWRKARHAVDSSRPRAARQAILLLMPESEKLVRRVLDDPARYLAHQASARGRTGSELTTLALMRMARNDPDAAAAQLTERWQHALPRDLVAWAWGTVAKQSAVKLEPDAADFFVRAEKAAKGGSDLEWPDDLLGWKVRSALRGDDGQPRWQQVMQAINAMSADEQGEPAWRYWKARALQALAKNSHDAASLRELAEELMVGLASQMDFYGALAAQDAGLPLPMPPAPPKITVAEAAAAQSNPGLVRGLHLIDIGLRSEGVREWNYTLRGMGDRELLAAAQLACDHKVWDRCINTSEKTRGEIDMAQRFPTPFRDQVSAQAERIGLDPAYVYGLIRQESRFITDARSGAGASGLMQLMPATARWTAKKIGLSYTPALIAEPQINLVLGTSYLKLVLDSFDGSQPLATAAYNAGPGRPRKWRQGPPLEPAIWAENIPFSETRDYVKKVLTNATWYATLMGTPGTTLKSRLGPPIGPAESVDPAPKDLP